MPNFTEKSFNFRYIFKNFFSRWYFYVIAASIIAVIILTLFLLRKKTHRNNLSRTQKLAYTAILSALCFVANAFTIPASNILQISFIATMGFVSGYMLGPGLGFVAAFVGDFLCALVFPTAPYSPIINVGTALWGYIPGVLFILFNNKDLSNIIFSFALGFILNSFCVNTIGLSLMYNMPFDSLLLLLPIKLLVVCINFVLSFALYKLLKRVLPKDKFNIV